MGQVNDSLNNSIGSTRFFANNIAVPEVKHEGASTSAPAEEDTSTPSSDHAAIGANFADHLNNPLLEKVSALVASALVASGVKKTMAGIKEGDRQKVLEGAKTTVWGTFQGLNAADKLFTCLFPLTQSIRLIGGLVNADLGLTLLYRDRKNKKATPETRLAHASAVTWGLRHATLGLHGLQGCKLVSETLAKCSPIIKSIVSSAPIIGALSAGFGVTGGALDVAMGVKNLTKGIKTDNKEKKILGSLDIGIGVAAGAACLLSGIPGMVVMGTGTALMCYRTWRTDKETIKQIIKDTKTTVANFGHKVKDTTMHLLGIDHEHPPKS